MWLSKTPFADGWRYLMSLNAIFIPAVMNAGILGVLTATRVSSPLPALLLPLSTFCLGHRLLRALDHRYETKIQRFLVF